MFFEKFKNNHLDEKESKEHYIKDGKVKKVYLMTIKNLMMLKYNKV